MKTKLTPADVTPEIFEAVGAMLAARVIAEDARDKVDVVARVVLRTVELYTDLGAGRRRTRKRILENDQVYMSEDEAGCSRFYKDLDTELRHRGWKPPTMDTDHCPALVAESALLDAEIEVLHAATRRAAARMGRLLPLRSTLASGSAWACSALVATSQTFVINHSQDLVALREIDSQRLSSVGRRIMEGLLMEDWLDRIRRSTHQPFIHLVVTIAIVFLALAGLVALGGELGLSEYITEYRVQIWLALLVLSVVSVLGYSLRQKSRQTSSLSEQVHDLEAQLAEMNLREESLLRLMETYKRAAYADVIEHLQRLLILTAKRQQWQEAGACVTKLRVGVYSDADSIDPEFAARERIDVLINIGAQADVDRNMQFVVKDATVPISYGIVSVREVYDEGAI